MITVRVMPVRSRPLCRIVQPSFCQICVSIVLDLPERDIGLPPDIEALPFSQSVSTINKAYQNGGNILSQKQPVLTQRLIFIMALTCGVVVANNYYLQPIETVIAKDFQVSNGAVGIAAMLTQFGYALGLLLLVPLGDIVNRRKLIIRMCLLSSLTLLGAYFAPTFWLFSLAAFLIGLVSIVPQIIIPYGAVLAGPAKRGRVMGTLLGGLLVGILLSRTVSGIVASIWPWRTIYLMAVVVILALALTLKFTLPDPGHANRHKLSYWQTLATIPGLIKQHRVLREAASNGFFMFGTFSLFWSTLIFYISSPVYHWGTREAGLLAIFGLFGALAAPLIGRLADRFSDRWLVLIGLLLETLAFIILMVGGQYIGLLVLSIILLDVGNQFGQVSNQTRVQNLGERISNRTNTVFMFSYFLGGSFGSLVGTLMWQSAGWFGVTAVGLVFQLCAYLCHFIIFHPKKA